MTKKSDILTSSEYIQNVLYFAIVKEGKVLIDTENTHYFSIDDELVYENYFSDFGPLNLGCVFLYCKKLNGKIRQHLNKQIIVHYTSSDPKKKTNSAFLLGCYGVLYLSLPPEEALRPLLMHGQIYRPFQDAVKGDSIYTISLLDCLQAIKKARDLGFFNFQDFNYEAYSKFEKTSDGDLSWIIPGKFLAFMGPIDNQHSFYHQPEAYIDYFLENNVGMVIRLNKRLYDETKFTNYGILHQDLIFPDGTCPPKNILFKFLQLSEEYDFAIAVHCKAGLGRTGSLIGCYLIKHYRMSAHEAIGWMRICRPGSVIGDQQHWLEQLESWLIKQGNFYRKRLYKDPDRLPIHEFGIYSSSKRSNQSSVADSSHLSPLPRKNIPNLTPPPRPRNSRVREVLCKKNEEEQCEWCSNYNFKINSGQRSPTRGDSNRTREVVGRTSNASGEPRIVRSLSRGSSSQAKGRPTDSNCAQVSYSPNRNYVNSTATMTPKYSDYKHSTVINTVREAKTLLSSSTFSRQNRLGELSSVIRVTPHKMPVSIKTKAPGKIPSVSKFVLSSASRESSLPQNRRRLGRSPSPPRQRPLEQTRATNTNSIEMNFKDNCKPNIKEALSRLKLVVPRERSLGAASLGNRQQKPICLPTPSVRSDERHLATQGDLLNCIKFQRRLRESIKTNHTTSTSEDVKSQNQSFLIHNNLINRNMSNKTFRSDDVVQCGTSTNSDRPSYSRLPAKNISQSIQSKPATPHPTRNTSFEQVLSNKQFSMRTISKLSTQRSIGKETSFNDSFVDKPLIRPRSPSPCCSKSPVGRRSNQNTASKYN